MRLYGSLQNRLAENARPPKPTVGMGGTLLCYSDREPVTVVEVSPDGKTLWFTHDKATRTDSNGMSESQSYEYETVPGAWRDLAKLDKTGRWRVCSMVTSLQPVAAPDGKTDWRWLPVLHAKTGKRRYQRTAQVLALGFREKYHDYSF